jgi:hypothetical protein
MQVSDDLLEAQSGWYGSSILTLPGNVYQKLA